MKIREVVSADHATIEQIHLSMGIRYQMPDLNGPLIRVRTAVEENGEIVAAAILKLEPETYLWVRPGLRPAVKWDAIRMIQKELVRQAMHLGFEQLVAYVPDCVRFSKRLLSLGWRRQDSCKPWALGVKR
jgi:hypothetical protein